MTAIDRLSDEDTQILKLGRGAIRGHTCKLLVIDPANGRQRPSFAAIRDRVQSRLSHAPRFRQRVVSTPLGVANPVWVDDPEFDISRHVTRIATSGPVDRSTLNVRVAQLMAEPLDPARPLWHMGVVEELDDGATAVIWRVHHSVADGTTCMKLAAALLWDREASEAESLLTSWMPAAAPSRWDLFTSGVRVRVSAWFTRRSAPGRLKNLGRAERVLSRELRPAASLTPLAGSVGFERNVAFASLPLEACRRAGKAISAAVTVNDVVLSVVAGAIREWLGSAEAIRVKVPVSLHDAGEASGVGNHDSFFFVDLPVDEPDPARRVLAINRETRERKLEHDAETLYRLGLHHTVAHWASSPHVFTFNVSNVPGPRGEVSVVGGRLRELYSLAEIARHHALRIAVISAAGRLSFGLCADRGLVADVNELAAGLERAGAELLSSAGRG